MSRVVYGLFNFGEESVCPVWVLDAGQRAALIFSSRERAADFAESAYGSGRWAVVPMDSERLAEWLWTMLEDGEASFVAVDPPPRGGPLFYRPILDVLTRADADA